MPRFTADQLAYARSKSVYLGRSESLEFLRTMDIRLSVGHWSAGDFCDRFAPPGYHSDDAAFRNDFEGQCRRTKAAGVEAIEIYKQFPDNVAAKERMGELLHQELRRIANAVK